MMTHLLDTSCDVQYLNIKLSACLYLLDSDARKPSLYRLSQACAGVCASNGEPGGDGVLFEDDKY